MKRLELSWVPDSSYFWSSSVRGKLCVNSLGEGDVDLDCACSLGLNRRPASGSISLSELLSNG